MTKKGTFTLLVFAVVLSFAVQLTGCKKELLMSKEALSFSADTVVFDTVFTTVGSATKNFKIYNPSPRPVKISSIYLEGGTSSPFRFNLDGVSGVQFSDIEIPGKDSLFGFVEVTLGENNQLNPLIIEDRILFLTNGVEQEVRLAAWGQDAYFHYNDLNEGIWPNDKPHVIYGYAAVDSAKSLQITAGTKIHLHKNSLLYVYKGSLTVSGTVNDKVIFEGDRLESFYDDVKGQYYGIYFQEALPSTIDHAIIKNGTAGIHVFSEDPSNTGFTLTITNTEIYNHASYGIFNYSGGKIKGENLSVHNNNAYAYFLLEGGEHDFRHCQFLGYGTDGNQPAVAIKNYFTRQDGITYIGNIGMGNFFNSIIYGTGESQIAFDTLNQGGSVVINYDFDNNLIRQSTVLSSNPGFTDNLWNIDPLFEDTEGFEFKIKLNSPLRNAGKSAYSVPQDIEGNTRDPQPDIGAYEVN
ncbi:MAG: choice-of-anchor Q domain-containing protein [Brumimicrobium sp.]|nr:choice-of-anchor Q domain-containing protein [Brumimicrobium sp.]